MFNPDMSIRGIIERCGGPERVADHTGLGLWAIKKWPRNGIPEKHWAGLRELADIPIEELHAANLQARGIASPNEAA
jgi:carbamoyl-phosphate synthase small subunit